MVNFLFKKNCFLKAFGNCINIKNVWKCEINSINKCWKLYFQICCNLKYLKLCCNFLSKSFVNHCTYRFIFTLFLKGLLEFNKDKQLYVIYATSNTMLHIFFYIVKKISCSKNVKWHFIGMPKDRYIWGFIQIF